MVAVAAPSPLPEDPVITCADAFCARLDHLSRRLLARVEGPPAPPAPLPPPGPALAALAEAHGLGDFALDALVLIVGAALDADVRRLLAAAGGSRRQAPTVAGLLSVLLERPPERMLAAPVLGRGGALLRSGLVRRVPIDDVDDELIATRRARAICLGVHPLADLPPWARITDPPSTTVSWTDVTPGEVARVLDLPSPAPPGAVCLVRGSAGSGRTTWARQVAPHAILIDGQRAAADPDELCDLLDDAALAGAPVILDDADPVLARGGALAARLCDVVDAAPLSLIAIAHDATPIEPRLVRRALFQIALGPPPPAVRRALWGDAGGREMEVVVEEIVLGPGQIASARRAIAAGVDPVTAALAHADGGGDLLQLGKNRLSLDDLVVADDVRAELRELVNAIRVRAQVQASCGLAARTTRGHGLSALFDGDSGTGKTLACDAIASELHLPLMRVNVATLVDKYVGETEKNLARVFAQARARGGILLFDEADALFGQRGDGTRAQDRHANLEINLLLQLLEDHPGIVLLTTNLKKNMDQAFMRRIAFKICFDLPDVAQREKLWRCHLPAAADRALGAAAVQRLAHTFELTGGAIKNAVVRATYRAAGAGTPIALDDLVECARIEIAAGGKVAVW